MRPTYLVFAVILLAAPIVVAGEMRLLTLDNESSIGDPKTPVCAVETWIACGLRNIKPLCDAVEAPVHFTRNFTPVTKESYVGISAYWYEIVDRWEISKSDADRLTAEYGEGPWRIGDVAVTLRWTVCRPEDSCVTESWNDPAREYGEGCPADTYRREPSPETTIVRRKDDRWVIIREYLDAGY
jgi:hypothetical protein